MEITWLGHSCFRIKGKDVVILTDPCGKDTGYTLHKQHADIVTVSHYHPGHSNIQAVEGEFREIKGPGEYELKNVFITGYATFHDAVEGQERGKNTVYVIEIEGVTICHLGDLGHTLSSDLEEEIGEVGVLLIPAGGLSTIDSTRAADIVRSLAPRIVIPMHYKTPLSTREFELVDNFLKKAGGKEIAPQPRLNVNKNTLPLTTEIVVLNYPGA
jgi:L-ascorbate metabolism protein UlaG (beta-lactamase superfamily)